jgi:serine/threonine protein kinase
MNMNAEYQFEPGNIHITDFGIAYATQRANKTGGRDLVRGCIEYMAPEIYHGTNIESTPMSDMWSVGCIGYEMCLGEEMTAATENFQDIKAYRDREERYLNLRRIPPRFGVNVHQTILACMTLDPARRFRASQLRNHINNVLNIISSSVFPGPENRSFLGPGWV